MHALQPVLISITAGLTFPGETLGPVQLASIHTSFDRSDTLYDWSVIGVLPLLRRVRVRLVGEVTANVDRVNNSGAGSTTLTVRTHEWPVLPLEPVIVMLYLPGRVEMVVNTWRLVLVRAPGASVMGFWPPITPRNPKGTVAERVTVPSNPFLLAKITFVELVNPATTVME